MALAHTILRLSEVMYFKDAGAELFASVSELGGDLICSLRPRWTSNLVQYVSNRRWINVTELREGRPNRLSGYDGELGPGNHSFSPTSEVSKRDFFAYYARLLIVQNPLAAVGHAFVYSSTLSSVINATKRTSPQDISSLQSPNTNLTSPANLWGTVLYGKTGAIQSLANFNARMNARRATTWIQPDQVAQFIQVRYRRIALPDLDLDDLTSGVSALYLFLSTIRVSSSIPPHPR